MKRACFRSRGRTTLRRRLHLEQLEERRLLANTASAGGIDFYSTSAGLFRFNADGTGSQLVAATGVGNLVAAGSVLYFSATDAAHGSELWRSDGTAGGTSLVADVVAGAGGSSAGNWNDPGNDATIGDATTTDGTWTNSGTHRGLS